MSDPRELLPGRRALLTRCGMGLGALALADLTTSEVIAAGNPLSSKQPHFKPRARHIIHLFMNGGPSHVDTFDPKVKLQEMAGKPLPGGNLKTERPTGSLFPSPYRFRQYGESGIPVSEIFRHTAECVDDMAVIRSMHADVPNHEPSLLLMNCGDV